MSTQTDTQHLLDERYGRRRSRRSRIAGWVVLAAVAGALVLALSWSTLERAMEEVDVEQTAFAVVDEHRVTLTFQVSAPADRAVACALEAQDDDHGVVGWRVVEYPGSDEPRRAFTEQIPTVAHATTGFVNSCWLP